MADPVWVIDTSSLIAIKSSVPHAARERVFEALSALVKTGRLFFPREVLHELKRDSADKRNPDRPLQWAQDVEGDACSHAATFEEVRVVLAIVPDILDPTKESGADDADPYVLALAKKLRDQGIDARVITEETRNSPTKLSLNTACGMLGIPSVPLLGLLRAESIS
jgi:hypothetical protein